MGGAAPKPKQDEFLPHPVKEQLPGVAYCMTSPPPWPEALLLGFQHYLVMLGSWDNCSHTNLSIIVSQMGGGNDFSNMHGLDQSFSDRIHVSEANGLWPFVPHISGDCSFGRRIWSSCSSM